MYMTQTNKPGNMVVYIKLYIDILNNTKTDL